MNRTKHIRSFLEVSIQQDIFAHEVLSTPKMGWVGAYFGGGVGPCSMGEILQCRGPLVKRGNSVGRSGFTQMEARIN